VFALDDARRARRMARKILAPYLAVGAYARLHSALGRVREVERVAAALRTRDREAASAAIPDASVDGVFVHGPTEACRAQLQRFLDAGVTTLCIDVIASDAPRLDAQRALLPV
jgi:hypothetical protein